MAAARPSLTRSLRALALALAALPACIHALGDEPDHHGADDDGEIGVAREGLSLHELDSRVGCTTAGTEGISAQLVDEMLCLAEGRLVRFGGTGIVLTSSRVHPYLSPSGRDMVERVGRSHTVRINSALRTIAEQYILKGGCSVAASPGSSNHETGRAIDVENYGSVGGALVGAGFGHPLPSSDPVHYEAPGDDLRHLSVLAFQRLWNANHPGDRIGEDGAAGAQTLSRLGSAPAGGFATERVCGACRPSTEVCNGRDDDCDGHVDEGVRNACGECGAVPDETCNGRDDDCDGSVDEGVCDRATGASSDAPEALALGEVATFTVTLRNAGTTTWNARHYAIVARADGGDATTDAAIGPDVAPRGTLDVLVGISPAREGNVAVSVCVTRDGAPITGGYDHTFTARRPLVGPSVPDVGLPASIAVGVASDAGRTGSRTSSDASDMPGGASIGGGCTVTGGRRATPAFPILLAMGILCSWRRRKRV